MSQPPNAILEIWNQFISAKIERFLTAFQQIEIDVTSPDADEPLIVSVHAPYMMQRVAMIEKPNEFAYLKKRHQDRLLRVKAARDQAPEPVRQFLQSQFFDGNDRERLLAAGRAELEELQTLLQEAVNQQLIPIPDGQTYLDGRTLRRWLQTYGIGVDCSSFVQQTLNRLIKAVRAAVGQDSDQDQIQFLRSFRAYKEVKNGRDKGEPLFTAVPVPANVQPGDVLVKYGHIRIVSGVENGEDGRLILHLAESTSAPDIPVGQTEEEADIGPRRLQICYLFPQRPIGEQRPLRKRQHDPAFQANSEEITYVLGRFIPLKQLGNAPVTLLAINKITSV
ncbi:MAG: hypothetical protein GY803_27050 [Chloroflexi bacterium]|nr:hypothetical protein [Chloroflexota bacterium]